MDDRIDLSPIDPAGDRDRFDAIVTRIAREGMAARAARPAGAVPLLLVHRWRRELLALAAAIAVLAGGSLLTGPARATGPRSPVESLGVPGPLARWAEQNRVPTVGELINAMAAGATGPSGAEP